MSKRKILSPKKSLILNSKEIFGVSKNLELNWYVVKCNRYDITAYAIHTNRVSGNSSGEHNF